MLLRLVPDVYRRSNHPIGHRPPYTLKYIEACLKREDRFSVTLLDQHISDLSLTLAGIGSIQRRIKPDVIVLDVSSLNESVTETFLRGMGAAQNAQTMLIAVGHAPSAGTEIFREKHPQFHITLAGEAEQEVVGLIQKFAAGVPLKDLRPIYENPPLSRQTWLVRDLDALPFPEYDRAELHGYHFVYPLPVAKRIVWGHILSSRGCPHRCVFCSQLMRESYGTEIRRRSAPNVVDEIEHLLKLGANVISFDDDNFTHSPAHVRSICGEILRRHLKIRWIAHARVDEVDGPLLTLMRDSGCLLIRYGVETVSKPILECLEKTPDPETWPEKTREAVAMAKALGIGVVCLFMIGCPGETRQELENDILFAQNLQPDVIQVAYFTPFPGSRYYATFRGQFPDSPVSELYHYNIPRINLSRMTSQEFSAAQMLFYKMFFFRPGFIGGHFRKYFLFYIKNFSIFCKLLKIKRHLFKKDEA
ncbi:MAG TPA: radical SAM protein [Candidatus Omnitrophota bacterium]|nr:radical SAM protein [Candidatus Omnitrophota bacterium]HPB68104.1 radical SAM protein [Candidatus Omnitrophota bacterium]HQO58530.1 radical SAM protein [Candidatus Omnitrophota bacterium]